jgi:mRNA interferase HigB
VVGMEDAEQPLKSWYAEAIKANWRKPSDIKDLYRHTSFVGTHKQYDKIDVEKV